jgi:hypothetical protein
MPTNGHCSLRQSVIHLSMTRQPLPPAKKLEVVPIRLNAEQKAKLARLGGAKWVREQIDKAKEPVK